MQSLRAMTDGGKTVILVTHSTLQLRLCDKIVFMGKGGNLCFFGSYDDALEFFGVSDIVDVYNMITDNAMEWREKYDRTQAPAVSGRPAAGRIPPVKGEKTLQLPVLCSRYVKLVANDRQRLLLLLAQAPALALLISLVADGQQFEQYDMTKSLLFALSCSAFWVGMLNAIQEVCKERSILKREYMAGLSLNEYILSKILVLGVLCLIQSALIVGVFAMSVGLPEEGLFLPPMIEFPYRARAVSGLIMTGSYFLKAASLSLSSAILSSALPVRINKPYVVLSASASFDFSGILPWA